MMLHTLQTLHWACVSPGRFARGAHSETLPESLQILASPREGNHGGNEVQNKFPGSNQGNDDGKVFVCFTWLSNINI